MTASDDPTRPTGGHDAARPAERAEPIAGQPDAARPEATRPTAGRPTTGPDGTATGRRAPERPDERPGERPGERRGEPRPAEEEPVPSGGGKTAGLWISLILGAIVLVLLLIFVIQNKQTTHFEYFSTQFDLPLGVAMLLAAIAGALVMALVGSVRMVQMSWTIRRLRKQQEKIHRATR